MCVSLQRRAIQNVKMYVSLQRRAQKSMKQAHGVGSRPRHIKIIVLPQFRTSDRHEVTKGLWNLHFTTVLDVRRAGSDERVARRPREFAFHHSFGRPTITFCVKGCFGDVKICISPQFWASDEHEVTRGLLRQSRKFAFHHSFGRPTSTKWREGCLPPRPTKPTLRKRKEEILKRSSIFEEQRSQQLFSAALLSSLSQQLFSAALLSSLSQQLFSAAFLSSSSQQLFSAAFLSSSSQQLFSAALLSSSSQQPFSAAFLSSSSQQLFSAALLSYHLAVVRGWWSASNIIFSSSSQQLFSAIILLWSGVGGQLVTSSSAALRSSSSRLSSCCGQGLVVKYATVL